MIDFRHDWAQHQEGGGMSNSRDVEANVDTFYGFNLDSFKENFQISGMIFGIALVT
jgi:hypothetical protein